MISEVKKVAVKKSKHAATKASGKVAAVKTLQKNKSTPKRPGRVSISPEQRNAMIAETAYYRAEQRGFADSDPLDDWLWAEAEIDKEP